MKTFADVCEQISRTTKKLEKERILAEYLRTLNDSELPIACTFLSGSPFPLRDQRTTNTGYAVVRDALLEVDPLADARLPALLVRLGDFGEAVEALFQNKTARGPELKLEDVLSYYINLTTSSKQQEKRAWTREILGRSSPREAKYIVKILMGGMRIGLQESLVESSIAKAFGQPLAQVQQANMLLGDIGESALLARSGRLSEARMRLLHPVKVMLASPEENVEKILEYMNGAGWAEDKYDGIRAHVHKDGEAVKIYSRDLDDVTASFPDVVAPLQKIEGSLLMDGEIVPWKEGRILSFAELQTRLGRKILPPEILINVPCSYFAFDLLFREGELIMPESLRIRRQRLLDLHAKYPDAFFTSTQREVRTVEDLESAFQQARNHNNEGLVIKNPESPYTPGKRGKHWLKLKRALVTLDVVVVAAEYGHGKRRGLLSDYTFAVQSPHGLVTIGKAYSGITDEELVRLSDLFHKLSTQNQGFGHLVRPEIVFEVTFDRMNRSTRHTSGYALRFPRIKRIRWDKKPEEIDTLETVENLFQAQS